jgi:hypothetical protein
LEAEEILERMRAYFTGKQPEEALAGFAGQSPRALLRESLDVVDFIVYLEEELGRDIDINQLGEALLNKNFGDLSVEVARLLRE